MPRCADLEPDLGALATGRGSQSLNETLKRGLGVARAAERAKYSFVLLRPGDGALVVVPGAFRAMIEPRRSAAFTVNHAQKEAGRVPGSEGLAVN